MVDYALVSVMLMQTGSATLPTTRRSSSLANRPTAIGSTRAALSDIGSRAGVRLTNKIKPHRHAACPAWGTHDDDESSPWCCKKIIDARE
jgi:hypothetical protein